MKDQLDENVFTVLSLIIDCGLLNLNIRVSQIIYEKEGCITTSKSKYIENTKQVEDAL